MNSSDSAHQFAFTMITGDTKQLSDYAGHPVLIVNTASKCGLTPQYAELEALYKKYAELGLVVIGVPSDNFGGQEYAEEAEVVAFTQDKFHITFPLTSLNDVKGKNAHPFYQWANKKVGLLSAPKWNFHKYLIGKNGELVASFGSTTSPMSPKITEAIEGILEENGK